MTSPITNATRVEALSINGRVHTLRDPVWAVHHPVTPAKVFTLHHRANDTTPWVPLRISTGALAAVVEGCAVQTDGVTVTRAQEGVKPPPPPTPEENLSALLRGKMMGSGDPMRHDPPAPKAKKRLTLRTIPTIGQRVGDFWTSLHLTISIVAAAWLTIGLALGYYFAKYF